uniref:DNA binding protein n=1 Tax=Rhizophora mucronata TaxID=61149 RepID=A0A2P2IU25_RHIMU
MNGYIPDNGPLPNKFQRPIPSSNLFIVNGRKLEPYQTAFQPASTKQGPVSNHRVDVKEHKTNGLITASRLDACLTRRPANIPANENDEMYQKPPHPDEKYLNWILSVSRLDTLPDSNDQEWLANSNHLQTDKLESSFPGVDGTQQVWAEALHIDSADIVALPYVIPY